MQNDRRLARRQASCELIAITKCRRLDPATIESISKPDAEVHNYQPTPGDILKAQEANLVLWNGLNLELWFERFFQRLKGVPGVVVSHGVQPTGIVDGSYNGKPNPVCTEN